MESTFLAVVVVFVVFIIILGYANENQSRRRRIANGGTAERPVAFWRSIVLRVLQQR